MPTRRRKTIAISGAGLAGAAALVSAMSPLVGKLIDRLLPPAPSSIQASVTYKPGFQP